MRTFRGLTVIAVLGAACAGVPLPRTEVTDPGGLLFNGYVRSEVDCYRCHNGDGRGALGPPLTRKVPGMSEEKMAKVIRLGTRANMPGYGSKLSEAEVAQLVGWLKRTFQ